METLTINVVDLNGCREFTLVVLNKMYTELIQENLDLKRSYCTKFTLVTLVNIYNELIQKKMLT